MKTKVEVTTSRRGRTFFAIADIIGPDGESAVMKYANTAEQAARAAVNEAMRKLFPGVPLHQARRKARCGV
jgi:hypothetical protein